MHSVSITRTWVNGGMRQFHCTFHNGRPSISSEPLLLSRGETRRSDQRLQYRAGRQVDERKGGSLMPEGYLAPHSLVLSYLSCVNRPFTHREIYDISLQSCEITHSTYMGCLDAIEGRARKSMLCSLSRLSACLAPTLIDLLSVSSRGVPVMRYSRR